MGVDGRQGGNGRKRQFHGGSHDVTHDGVPRDQTKQQGWLLRNDGKLCGRVGGAEKGSEVMRVEVVENNKNK